MNKGGMAFGKVLRDVGVQKALLDGRVVRHKGQRALFTKVEEFRDDILEDGFISNLIGSDSRQANDRLRNITVGPDELLKATQLFEVLIDDDCADLKDFRVSRVKASRFKVEENEVHGPTFPEGRGRVKIFYESPISELFSFL